MEFFATADEIIDWLVSKLESHTVYVPRSFGFERVSSSEEIKVDVPLTVTPPKNLFFPHTEKLMMFGRRNVTEILPEKEKKIVFGIRPCDVHALKVLDTVFLSDPADPYYGTRRGDTILVTLACTELCPGSFCDKAGIELEGDVVITPLGEGYHVEVRNEELAEEFGSFRAASEEEKEEASKRRISSKQAFKVEWLKDAFEDEVWEKVARFCIGCGVCTYLCPTCHCFDITDSGNVRIRTWDSCQFPYFTMHTSGHNPRPEKKHRLRNRIYHKFSYFPERHGFFACVGCGRCVRMCPSRIDIRELVLGRD
ncbi:4Fe-4S dicluster domain-containing protein [Archaeoglobus veneficus]|uniref:4Fe-4S ferredoxin iron-sulfur binding domain protein n=1 Tax=Archaeoglobus veneficus (strain DSM 11195 / SNP6) TaxID=693661 RepID=F2KSM5_ARCVS|nr:4Fe-4S dicluster domain-containing protein [Archaeoglobus veneficus]AEA48095.1 4Fe-4S ferredoxin iron-sulfur binding domain protein [Archaeoglobus veneficus SNP6]